ncbi:MliC family protein [Gemmobacter sp.]|uniref:MliC family protein n=1 Tax=Gemmobacter sp. TaxID=1898957 RepID=UPI002AFFC153|nr:MliC family protein [Gemmobacter sp.]
MTSLARAALLGLATLPPLALPALAQTDEITTVTYACERGAQVLASYLNIGDRSLAVLTIEGRQLVLETVTSASGAKYLTTGDQPVHVWWTKGDGASFFAGKEEVGIYVDCLAVPG